MFRFVDRQATAALVIVPGWAFDYRVFSGLDLPYNYYIFDGPSLSSLAEDVEELTGRLGTAKVSFLGWSRGAFAVCDIARRTPEWVDELFLVGVRRRYDREDLEHLQKSVRKNKAACLKGFYRQCFSRDEMEQYQWFKRTLLKDYLETISIDQLTEDLSWLGQAEIHPQDLRDIEEVTFVHGAADAIAPLEQAADLANALPQARLVTLERAGHIPFLHRDFKRRLYGN